MGINRKKRVKFPTTLPVKITDVFHLKSFNDGVEGACGVPDWAGREFALLCNCLQKSAKCVHKSGLF